MGLLQTLGETRPLSPTEQWGPVITVNVMGYGMLGGLTGGAVGGLVEQFAYPQEVAARSEMSHAQFEQIHDQGDVLSAISRLGPKDPRTIQLSEQLAADNHAVTSAQTRLQQTPNHETQCALEASGIAVAASLAICAVKLGVQALHTRRAA
jgi:hypothetical protein